MLIEPIRTWGPVELVFAAREPGESFADPGLLMFRFHTTDPPDVWRYEGIAKNWVCRMNERYWRAERDARTATLAHVDTLQAWMNQTRSIAQDLRAVYGDRLADVLEYAAGEIEQATTWPDRRIENPPRDAKSRADLFLTVDQWAHDRVVETVKACCQGKLDGIPGKDAGRITLIAAAIAALDDAGVPRRRVRGNQETRLEQEVLAQRVRRLKVRAGEEDNLVADALDACRSGPYDADGREKQPPD